MRAKRAENHPFGPGGFGDRRHTGVVLSCFGFGVAAWVVAELGKHSGAEDESEAGLAAVDLSVRMLAKTLLHLPASISVWVAMAVSTANRADALAV